MNKRARLFAKEIKHGVHSFSIIMAVGGIFCNCADMGRQKYRLQRADEWALNSLVAAAAAEDFEEFSKIRVARREVDPANAVSREYYDLLVTVVAGLRASRSFSKEDFDGWFSCTCISNGFKGKMTHVRIPRMDRKGRACFADVVWVWVQMLRSKYVEVKWRYGISETYVLSQSVNFNVSCVMTVTIVVSSSRQSDSCTGANLFWSSLVFELSSAQRISLTRKLGDLIRQGSSSACRPRRRTTPSHMFAGHWRFSTEPVRSTRTVRRLTTLL